MSRYTYEESLKIEYFKCRIREIRHLNYQLATAKSRLEEAEFELVRFNREYNMGIITSKRRRDNKIEEKWNGLIQEKDYWILKIANINNEMKYAKKILDSLSPDVRSMAFDLLVRKHSVEKVKDKHYVSNPYQCINDELRYLEIDYF